jgi:hypothetical protein
MAQRPFLRSIFLPLILVLALGVFRPLLSRAALVLNELHPDPAGSDGGQEFVEILNTGTQSATLEGVVLAFANGATGGPWEVRWTGGAQLTLAPGARFLIADRNWTGVASPDVEVWLGLQNGPDALRLERGGEVLDMVGYGPLTDAALMETAAADLEPGRSLARRPDGWDTGNNRDDFATAEPTPGESNFQPHEWTVDGWDMEPPSLDRPGLLVVFTVHLRNTGTETLPLGPAVLIAGTVESRALLDETEPDEVRTLVFGFVPQGEGPLPLELITPAVPGETALVLRPATLQVGPARVLLNEVLASPGDGQGEWIELRGIAPGAVDLSGFSLGDADGAMATLPPVHLEEGGFVVLAQDSLGLVDWLAENSEAGVPQPCPEPGPVHALTGWPTLNNTAPDDRDFADRVVLVDAAGTVLDHVTLGGGGLQGGEGVEGRSLERMAKRPVNPGFSNWAVCGAPARGTPGCPNSVRQREFQGMGLSAEPRILDTIGASPLIHFRFEIPGGRSGWRLQIYDLGGALVRDLGGDDLGSGPRDMIWDGKDNRGSRAGPGGYVAALDRHGAQGFAERILVVIR